MRRWSQSEDSRDSVSPAKRHPSPAAANQSVTEQPLRVNRPESIAESNSTEYALKLHPDESSDSDDIESQSLKAAQESTFSEKADCRQRYARSRAFLTKTFPDIEEEVGPVPPDQEKMGSVFKGKQAPELPCPKLKRHAVYLQNLQTMDTLLETTRPQSAALKYNTGTFVLPKSQPYDNFVSLKASTTSLPDEPIPVPAISNATKTIGQAPFAEAVSKSASSAAAATNHLLWLSQCQSERFAGLLNSEKLKDVSDEVREFITEMGYLQEESWFSILNVSKHVSAIETNVVLDRRDRQIETWRGDIPAHVIRKARCAKVSGDTLFNGAVAGVAAVLEKSINSRPKKEVIVTSATPKHLNKSQNKSFYDPRGSSRGKKGYSSSKRGGRGRHRGKGRGHGSSGKYPKSDPKPKGSDSKRRFLLHHCGRLVRV